MLPRLRAVIALEDDQIDCGVRQPHLDVFLIFGRAIAGERRGLVGKLISRNVPHSLFARKYRVACCCSA
jgi:hypothetical protein